jgi:hypothetical protein
MKGLLKVLAKLVVLVVENRDKFKGTTDGKRVE